MAEKSYSICSGYLWLTPGLYMADYSGLDQANTRPKNFVQEKTKKV